MLLQVGTSQTFNLDTSVGGPTPMTPISPYSPVSPGGSYPAYPTDDRSSSVPAYGRSGYPQAPLPAYSYDTLETPTYVGDDSRSWATSHRPSTAVSYYEQETPTAYDYPTPVSRISSGPSEPLSPLNMSTLQSSLPLPLERRLPAPNLVGSPISPDNDIRGPITARMSSMCISGPYSRSNSASWAVEGVERRQPSIQDLAEASMMLPPVTRGLTNPSTLPAPTHEIVTPMTTAMFVPSQNSDDLTSVQASTSATQPTYYTTNTSALPSLTTNMLPPTNCTRYTAINNSASSLPLITPSPDHQRPDTYYSWTPTTSTNVPDTTAPAPLKLIDQPQSTAGADRRASTTARYPPLHHPRPKIVSSTPHATTLEKADRVQQQQQTKNEQNRRPSSGGNKAANTVGGSQQQKKSGHKPSKGSL